MTHTAQGDHDFPPHPNEQTCIDCSHFPRCEWLINVNPEMSTCDWVPSRFVAKVKHIMTNPEPTRLSEEDIKNIRSLVIRETGPCSCHEGYTSRKLIDPGCHYHEYVPALTAEIERLVLRFKQKWLKDHDTLREDLGLFLVRFHHNKDSPDDLLYKLTFYADYIKSKYNFDEGGAEG